MGFEFYLTTVNKSDAYHLSNDQLIDILYSEEYTKNDIDYYCSDGAILSNIVEKIGRKVVANEPVYELTEHNLYQILEKICRNMDSLSVDRCMVKNYIKFNEDNNSYTVGECDGAEVYTEKGFYRKVYKTDYIEEADELILTDVDEFLLYRSYMKTILKALDEFDPENERLFAISSY